MHQPLGVAVVGGLVVSQALTLLTIPVTYLYMDRLSDWLGGRRQSAPLAPDHALVLAGRHPPPAIPDRHAAE